MITTSTLGLASGLQHYTQPKAMLYCCYEVGMAESACTYKGAMFFYDLVYVRFGDLAIPRSLHL